MIKLSVIVPVYNSEEYLRRTIINLQKMIGSFQKEVELIFVDDGSEDGSVKLLENITTKFANVKLICNSHQGVSKARNTGINNATGKYITFLDSDDDYRSNFLEIFIQYLKYNVDIIWFDVHNIQNTKLISRLDAKLKIKTIEILLGLNSSNISIQEGIASKFYKTDFLKKNKLFFNENVVTSEDTLFAVQSIVKAQNILLSGEKFYTVLEEHSLNRFKKESLEGELQYHKTMKGLIANYKNTEKILDRIQINGFCGLIHRYYGPMVMKKKITRREAIAQLKQLAIENGYNKSWKNNTLDNLFPLRYRLLRRALAFGSIGYALEIDIVFDKIKRVKW